MQTEQLDILETMRQYTPFAELPEEAMAEIARTVEISYYKAGGQIMSFGDHITDLYFIRSGAVELYRRSGDLYNRLSEGDIFGQMGLLMEGRVRLPAVAMEDTLLYCIPEATFRHLVEQYPQFSDYVEVEDRTRLRQAVSNAKSANEALTSKVIKLVSREPVCIEANATVRQAALKMTEEKVSALVITQPAFGALAPEPGASRSTGPAMVGIVTDRDLRNRVISPGLGYDTPVAEVMSENLITVRADQYVFDAMLTMLYHNVHHLPVVQREQPVGVLGISDIIQYESQNSLFVVRRVMRQQSVEALAELADDVRASFRRMVQEDANSHMVGSAMSAIGRTITQRLLAMAEEKLGPPPVPYLFMVLGSMAREEQLIVSDQDNALVLSDDFNPELHDAYFKELAAFVSDGLAACGYSYCTGDIMATNDEWRQPLSVWKQYFLDWMENPNAKALLNISIFLDLAAVSGEQQYAEELKTLISRTAPKQFHFLAALARNALNRTPPLGFFKNFVMEKDGKHNNKINLKRRGTAPLTDLIRIHALACGSKAQNSFERLNDIEAMGWLSHGIVADLRDAMEFISIVRIRQQVAQMERGEQPTNHVAPEFLTPFERRNLKDAFQVLSHAQKFLRFRYPPGGRVRS